MGRIGLALLLCGCSFQHGALVDGDAQTDALDGQRGGDAVSDGPLGPWGAPVAFPELTSAGTGLDDPTLTADMLEIYFNSNRGGNDDIWMSTRLDTTRPWDPPTAVLVLNSLSRESDPEVAPDGLTLWLASDRAGGLGGDDLYVSTRLSRTLPWSAPLQLTNVNSAGSDAGSTTDAAQQRLVFWSTRSGGAGAADLYESTRGTSNWNTPARLAAVSTSANDYDPYVGPDALTLFFDSDRPGVGQQDLYVTTRPSVTSTFAPPQLITELSTSARDMDPWLTPDLRTMVFASNRSGELEIYITTR